MKQLALFVAALSLFGCYRQKPINANTTTPVLQLTGDSGYIKNIDAYTFMLATNLTDTTNQYAKENAYDTAGKYYLSKENGHYFVCFNNYQQKYTFETLVLAELNKDGKLIKAEDYFHGNYCNCWLEFEFHKYGDYLGVITCGTGSAYSASYLYLFKEIMPQDSVTSIPLAYWHGGTMHPETLYSEIEIVRDTATIHYTLENGELNDSMEYIIKETRNFNVNYIFGNGEWFTVEQDKYEGLAIGW